MNRRDVLIGSGLVVGSVVFNNTSAQPIIPKHEGCYLPDEKRAPCTRWFCENFLELTAREFIQETGDWKKEMGLPRAGKPMVYSFYGCCGCQISLDKDGNWQYERRSLTVGEHRAFKEEYGNQAYLLHGLEVGNAFQIRGFVLNGRKEGWSLSTKSIA